MPLTDIAIRAAAPREKPYKLADGGGLYLLVTPSGGKLWRLKYRVDGIEKKLAIGAYPSISLAEARAARGEAHRALRAGNDPALLKRREKAARQMAAGVTFEAVAEEYITKVEREKKALATVSKLRWALEWLRPGLGKTPIDKIEPHEVLAVLRKQEAEGLLETARRTRAFASRVFRYAVATARAKSDPAALLRGAIAAPRPQHLAAILEPRRVGELLRAIDGYSGAPATRLALALSPHAFVRPGELRQAEWSEFDFGAAIWRIPAIRMKKRREHVVPLSRQSLDILAKAQALLAGDAAGLQEPDRFFRRGLFQPLRQGDRGGPRAAGEAGPDACAGRKGARRHAGSNAVGATGPGVVRAGDDYRGAGLRPRLPAAEACEHRRRLDRSGRARSGHQVRQDLPHLFHAGERAGRGDRARLGDRAGDRSSARAGRTAVSRHRDGPGRDWRLRAQRAAGEGLGGRRASAEGVQARLRRRRPALLQPAPVPGHAGAPRHEPEPAGGDPEGLVAEPRPQRHADDADKLRRGADAPAGGVGAGSGE